MVINSPNSKITIITKLYTDRSVDSLNFRNPLPSFNKNGASPAHSPDKPGVSFTVHRKYSGTCYVHGVTMPCLDAGNERNVNFATANNEIIAFKLNNITETKPGTFIHLSSQHPITVIAA
jgi:hypothetical protein